MSDKELRDLERQAVDGDEAAGEALALARCRVGEHEWSNWTTDYEWRETNENAEARLMKYLKKRACFWCFKIDYERFGNNRNPTPAPCGQRACILMHDDFGNHYHVDDEGQRTLNSGGVIEITCIGAEHVQFPRNCLIQRVRLESRVEPDSLVKIYEQGLPSPALVEAWVYASQGGVTLDVNHFIRDRTVFEIDISPGLGKGSTADDVTIVFEYVALPPSPARCGHRDLTGHIACELSRGHAGSCGTFHTGRAREHYLSFVRGP